MSYIKSRKHVVPRSGKPLLGAAAAALSLSAALAHAHEVSDSEKLDRVTVLGSRLKTDNMSSPKYTAPLRDTPQTITVIPAEVLEQQNSLSLQEVLTSNVPGITFQAGEGGGGYGDNIMLRGYNASENITLDGARDAGQYTRSDFFNIENLEVTSGANSVHGGSNNVAGSINLSSKRPQGRDFVRLGLGLGTDSYYRGTVDVNSRASDAIAWRLNVMAHNNNVAERDVERFRRFGIAPSISFGMGGPTRLTLAYFYQQDDNIPQYGVPYANTPYNNGPIAGIRRNNYYGYRNTGNGEELRNQRLSVLVEHDFNENSRLRNYTYYGQTERWTQVDSIRGSWCVNGVNPYGMTLATRTCSVPDNTFLPNSGPHGYIRDENNQIIGNQTDFITRFATGSMQHDLVVGLSLSQEDFKRRTGSVLGSVAANDRNPMSASNPNGIWTHAITPVINPANQGQLKNAALYVFDNLRFNEQWALNGGLRYERVAGESRSYDTANNAWRDWAKNSDSLISYRLGLVFKPVENGSIYLAYGNSRTPSMSSVRGSCNQTSSCNVDPETAINIELGSKWDVLDGRLGLSAALFRNERSNYKVASGDPNEPEQQLDGKARVDGLALGLAGQITREWGVFANYTYLKSKVIQSVSDHVRTTTGIDAQAGNPLTQTPKHAANLWTTYRFGDNWVLGYGASYSGRYYLNNAAAPLYTAPGYTVHNAMLGWKLNDALDLQLNVKNLANKEYYTRIRGHAASRYAVPGTGRTITLSANFKF